MRRRRALLGIAAYAFAGAALADEGLWPFEHLPRDLLASRRGVTLDDAWVGRSQLASLRLTGGCTATFVAPRGLLITTRACVEACLAENSTAGSNIAADGLVSRSPLEEKRCRKLRGQVLLGSEDISGQIALATAGLDAGAAAVTRDRELARLEQACEQVTDPKAPPVDCEPVGFYGGGEYRLYKYRNFDDLRVSFAPDRSTARLAASAADGPFLAFDLALLRAYDDGKPVDSPAFLRVNFAGPAEREALFVVGHPVETARNTTLEELLTARDTVLQSELLEATELRGRYAQFALSSALALEHAAQPAARLERELAERSALFNALLGESQISLRRAAEEAFRARISADVDLRLSAGSAFDEITAAQHAARAMAGRRNLIANVGRRSTLVGAARLIVRAGLERQKPDAERPLEFRTAELPRVERALAASESSVIDMETLGLTFSLERLRDRLGATDPLVARLLGSETPAAVAERAISRTRIGDSAFRLQLWNAGAGAVVTSDDPLIALVRELEAAADAVEDRWQSTVEAPMLRANERLARARLKFADAATYPDATGTLRLSSGTLQGWSASGQSFASTTTLGEIYATANAGRLPVRWMQAKDRVTGSAGLNVALDSDTGAGCAGCAVLGAGGDLLGVIIDRNRAAAAGRYGFDAASSRAIALDTAALKEILLKVYRADELMKEMVIAR